MPTDQTQIEKCHGCQSFCMLGNQLALYGKDGTRSATDGWLTWETIAKDKTIAPNEAYAGNPQYLSAANQKSLVKFIQDSYNTGARNPHNGLMSEGDPKNTAGLPNILSDKDYGTYGTSEPSELANAARAGADGSGGEIASSSIIYPHHYNDFIRTLWKFTSPVSTDPKGDGLGSSNKNGGSTNNAKESGPVCGWPQAEFSDVAASGSAESTRSDPTSQITASMYQDLYKAAKKLMFHPYQCDICNVYEGGEFGEIVRELGSAVMATNTKYSWKSSVTVNVNIGGYSGNVTCRTDCSGFVGECVNLFLYANGKGFYHTQGEEPEAKTYISGGSAAFGPGTDLFTNSITDNIGVIYASDSHVEASDDNGLIWSGGGNGDCWNGQPDECHESSVMMHTSSSSKVTARWKAV